MSSPSPLVYRALDLRQLPAARPLNAAYAQDYASVSSFFAGNPVDPAAWRDTIARVTRARRDRAGIAAVLDRQLTARNAPPAALRAVARLSEATSVAIVTGQQAGLFGGPLYTLLKAITALQLARDVTAQHGVPAVALFWVAGEDHDWQEVRTARVLDQEFARRDIALADLPGAGAKPVDALVLDGQIDVALTTLETTLAPSEFRADVVARLRRHYQPGVSMAGAFARWLDDLLGAQGLVVFDGADASAKRLATDIFARELAEPERSMGLVAAACDRLRALGHQPQVEPAADGTTLFYLDEAGRHPIKRRGQMLAIGGRECTPVQLVSEATSHPERFSPNVLLRSVVQDQLFPTICYVGGPAEIAYQAELGGIYQALGVERPLLYPRASATVIDSATARFLDRFLEQPNVTFAGLQTQNELLLNQILASQIPADLERGFAAAAQEIGARIDAIRAALPAVDPTLTGAADTTRDRLIDSLKQLHGKTVQAAKRKDETLRRQFLRTQALVFPGGHPQERDLSLPFFVNRYGTGLVDRLVDGLPHEPARHYLLIP